MISHSQFSHENQPYRDRINEIYARGVKAFGNQDSVLDTHKCLLDIFNRCIDLTTEISNAKHVAKELPVERPRDLESLLLGHTPPPREIVEDGFETIAVLFDASIKEIERHVNKHG